MSWIILNKETRQAVYETWQKRVTLKINKEKYIVKTAKEYLSKLNNN